MLYTRILNLGTIIHLKLNRGREPLESLLPYIHMNYHNVLLADCDLHTTQHCQSSGSYLLRRMVLWLCQDIESRSVFPLLIEQIAYVW